MQKEEFITLCKRQLHKPYVWGTDGPDTFDCSGLAQFFLALVGLDPPGDQTASDLYRHFSTSRNGRPVATAECGCLVFYGRHSKVGHVGICLDEKEMIEAGGGGPEITSVALAKQHNAEVRIANINRRDDIVAIIRPNMLPWSGEQPAMPADHRVGPPLSEMPMLWNTIDISHWQTVSSHQEVKDAGIALVFHKATQGLQYVDPAYQENMKGFKEAGVAWGSYHFGVGGDGSDQADHFLSVADTDSILVLDLEPNTTGKSMSLAEAEEFVQYVRDVTGRYPGIYSGHTLRELLGDRTDSPLVNCWLWTARYSKAPVIPRAWKTWTFWQYTDGKVGQGPHEVKGIGPCDRDVFNGDEQTFKAFLIANRKKNRA
ncbi:MAG: GH25 family lysozyme [Syntrophobacteraceae bacterium]|nr:NlpC/P60 family protein [Desulfobacteraceae bacterium]